MKASKDPAGGHLLLQLAKRWDIRDVRFTRDTYGLHLVGFVKFGSVRLNDRLRKMSSSILMSICPRINYLVI